MIKKGYIQIYTGNGKGKTTASLGLSLRAAGAGLKVFIAQFVKGMQYSELKAVKWIDNITIKQYGRDCFIYKKPEKKDFEEAQKGFQIIKKVLKEGKYDVVILDEANIALYYELFSLKEFIDALKHKKEHVEVIITGRKMPGKLYEIADLITEMKEIKHYYNKGVEAREGIEN
ncbi:MAG: cob(I)yrinic acid a,c-diamide adenosyltransferase [Candidatus Muiribacteriota bacterium]